MAQPKWEQLQALRRELHQHPEVGFKERETQERMRTALLSAGLEPEAIRECAQTGLVADIRGTGESEARSSVTMVALRTDLDALPMTESNAHLPYRSANEGVAHMCGHDGHMACLIGAATFLIQERSKIPKTQTVRLLFQPAEESPGGAPLMIEEGCLEGVDEVYGMHNWPTVEFGTLLTKVGPVMAHTSRFEVIIKGKGGHGSQPHQGVDPIVCASACVLSLQTVISRNVSYADPAVLSVCFLHGGETSNVIPDTCRFGGTIRDLSPSVFDTIQKRFIAIVEKTCEAYGCECVVDIQSRYPVLVNTEKETGHVIRLAKHYLGPDKVGEELLPMLAAEDFAYYLEKRPGCFFFWGTKEEGRTNALCHSSDFDFNDNIIPTAVTFWVRLVEYRLGVSLLT